ncbi:hypothetical protein SLS63_005953 [Diaporthe eres]|uniref:OPT oligopeptide transporter n=2 Tax=Diaporthe eres species complex TaxID=2972384 RepID=A0ABR1P9K7_DIAER
MPNAGIDQAVIVGGLNPVENKVFSVPTHSAADEKEIIAVGAARADTDGTLGDDKIKAAPSAGDDGDHDKEEDDSRSSDEVIIITGADAARHLLPMRDDFDTALTFRSLFLASGLSCFQAVMSQIYTFKPTAITISGTFIVLIAYFLGKAWAAFLPRGDKFEARWRAKGGQGNRPKWISAIHFINPGPWTLKEHAVCAITATSASNASASVMVFAAQDLFYDLPLSAATVILSTISIGLFGYGICGVMRPIAVWHVDAVYWSTLPTVKTLQGLHWQDLKNSKPLRYFWYSFGGMFAYEWFPAYMFPWLNSVSIPCLAAMKATGSKAAVLTNLFGGSINNEGIVGYLVCFAAMLGIYYTNAWESKSLPFMSTSLRTDDGGKYPISEVFTGGVLNQTALAENGLPRLTGSFAYSMFMANAAIGALVLHCFLFWGGDVIRAFKSAKAGRYDDRHHAHMAKHFKIPPRVMFLTQIYGTILGGFINYAVMISIVNGNRDLLVNSNGNSSWSGATMQSYNTNATSWALANYLYGSGGLYYMVPVGLAVGAGLVIVHRIFVFFVPKIKGFSTSELNLPQFIQYAGYIPYNASQTCVIFSQVIAGFFTQFYLRNYRPRIFRDYSYLVTGAFDGASLAVLFILSFAVFGAGGPSKPFPTWWGNNADGYYDLCPSSSE